MQAGIPIDKVLPLDLGMSLGLSTTLVGMVIVFIGLVLLVLLSWVMSKMIAAFAKKPALVLPTAEAPKQDRGELAAAVAASIASSMNVMPQGLRILSIKKRD